MIWDLITGLLVSYLSLQAVAADKHHYHLRGFTDSLPRATVSCESFNLITDLCSYLPPPKTITTYQTGPPMHTYQQTDKQNSSRGSQS